MSWYHGRSIFCFALRAASNLLARRIQHHAVGCRRLWLVAEPITREMVVAPDTVGDDCLGRCSETGCSCGDFHLAHNGIMTEGTVIGDPAYKGRAISSRGVTDGLSKTIAAGEKRMRGQIGDCQSDDSDGWYAGWDWNTIRFGHFAPKPDQLETPDGGS